LVDNLEAEEILKKFRIYPMWPCAKTVMTQFPVPTVQWVVLKEYDDAISENWVTNVQTCSVELRLIVIFQFTCAAARLNLTVDLRLRCRCELPVITSNQCFCQFANSSGNFCKNL